MSTTRISNYKTSRSTHLVIMGESKAEYAETTATEDVCEAILESYKEWYDPSDFARCIVRVWSLTDPEDTAACWFGVSQ